MSRKPRQKSQIGLYRITMRGNGKQLLFEDDADRGRLLSLVRSSLSRFNVKLIAWCLMGNHVHLVASDPDDNVSESMHLVMSCYATWYNRRHGHVGHVFRIDFRALPFRARNIFSMLFDTCISIRKKPVFVRMASIDGAAIWIMLNATQLLRRSIWRLFALRFRALATIGPLWTHPMSWLFVRQRVGASMKMKL